MSKNFFAALDDSGDEGPAPAKPVAEKKKEIKPKPQQKVVEASQVDPKKRPNQGDRNTKYGRGGRAPARDGKREYDRRSGTGRGREVKKGGGGARNWGSDKNEAREAEGHVDEEAVDPAAEDVTESKEDVAEIKEGEEDTPVVEPEPEPEPEPEDKTMSYEEYLAVKTNPDNEAFKPVKEREVENEFAGMKVAKKVVDEDFMKVGGDKQKKSKQKKVTPKETIALDFRLPSTSGDDRGGGRGGRDGRGRGRGGRDGRSGGRGDREGGRGGREGGRGGGEGGRGGRDGGRGGRDGGRGGRDGGRGGRDGRGRGGGRGGGRNTGGGSSSGGGGRGLNVMDESAFPSLG